MIFVDTNYFLRYLLQDNQVQYQKAKQLFIESEFEFMDACELKLSPKINHLFLRNNFNLS